MFLGLKKNLSRAVILFFAVFTLVLSPLGSTKVGAAPCSDFNQSILGIPTWYKYLDGETVGGECSPTFAKDVNKALPIGLAVLEILLTLSGMVAIAYVIIGGIKFIISVGEPAKAAGARQTVLNALIGLAIVMIATRLVSFIANRIT